MCHNLRWMRFARLVLLAASLGAPAAQTGFRDACASGIEARVLEAALRNPELALRQASLLLPLPFAPDVLERLAALAPADAMAIAASSPELFAALAAGSPAMRQLAALASDSGRDLATRRRAAFLAGAMARGAIDPAAVWPVVASTPRYFAELADLRPSVSPDEAAGFDRALEYESAAICRAAQQSGGHSLAALATFRTQDVFLLLAYGGPECGGIFPAAFDRFLRTPLTPWLERNRNWRLREFTAGALDAGRFEGLLRVAGAAAIAQLARGLTDVAQAEEIAEIVAVSRRPEFNRLLAQTVAAEWRRSTEAQDSDAAILYGLLSARLLRAHSDSPELREAGSPYLAALAASDALETAPLFDERNRCIQRYFFWDDDDGVQSFEHFLSGYRRLPGWKIDDHGSWVEIGRSAAGRSIEIFANVPIDIREPANREREGEAQRRQAVIEAELARRGLTARVLVHRGHSFHVEKTLGYVTPAARLVVLGSCRGVPEIHRVLAAAHDAQVIATRGSGAMQINDAILLALNARLLTAAPRIRWAEFWRDQQHAGPNSTLQQYVTPDRDEASAFLRAYYQVRAARQPAP